jgi:hypothetical protein
LRLAALGSLALAVVVLTACTTGVEGALERLDVDATPAAKRTTAAEFRDLSIPQQTDVLLRFYEFDRTADCSNVEYDGAADEFFDRVRGDAFNEPDERSMSEVLIRYCLNDGAG